MLVFLAPPYSLSLMTRFSSVSFSISKRLSVGYSSLDPIVMRISVIGMDVACCASMKISLYEMSVPILLTKVLSREFMII